MTPSKRLFDILFALLILPLVGPLFLGVLVLLMLWGLALAWDGGPRSARLALGAGVAAGAAVPASPPMSMLERKATMSEWICASLSISASCLRRASSSSRARAASASELPSISALVSSSV